MIDNVEPWMPCARCGMLPPDCMERPADVAFWEDQLERSREQRRHRQIVFSDHLHAKAAA